MDHTIKCLIHFRNVGSKPSAREVKAQTREVKQLLNQWVRIVEKKGILYHSKADNHGNKHQQLLLPASLHEELLKGVHDHCRHQGLARTEQLVRERCWWPGLHNNVKKYLSECEHFVVAKGPYLTAASDGRENVLVLTHVFIKFTVAVPTRDQRASTIVKTLVC